MDPNGVTIADQQFAVGDRVIARRNDRYRDVDNGTLGRVTELEPRTGSMTIITDSGDRRVLDAAYAAAHLEHAYALTGHGAHGATVEWAGVIGRPSEFTREWAYTSLSRARAPTRVYLINEATIRQREREEYAPPEPQRTRAEAIDVLTRAMLRREAEPLALVQAAPADIPQCIPPRADLPLADLAEAGAERAARVMYPAAAHSRRDHQNRREGDRGQGLER